MREVRMEPGGELVVEKVAQAWLLILRGEHDLSSSPALNAELDAVFERRASVVVDLAEASFIDSSVAGALMRASESAGSGTACSVVLCAPEGTPPRRLLDMVGVTRVIPTFETRTQAIEHLATHES
jgi:anti-anti-sigma factor